MVDDDDDDGCEVGGVGGVEVGSVGVGRVEWCVE